MYGVNRAMKILVASDIYGVTPDLAALAGELGSPAVLLSPWAGDGCPFSSESEAHTAFVAGDGLEAYAAGIAAAAGGEPVFLVGFSVGATASWLYAAGKSGHPQSRALLFYGSRIRHYVDCLPAFPLGLIFAEHEPAFSPAAIAPRLASPAVDVRIEPDSRHGFMNRLSPGFSVVLYARYAALVGQETTAWRSRLRVSGSPG